MTTKILIVDDSATVRREVLAALAGSGFRVVEAVDGHDGLRQVDAHDDIALVLCDVNMPNMNGVEMVEQLKERGSTHRPPVVMLTTEGQPSLILRAKKAGVRGWIVKPFQPALLVESVRRLTAQPA